MIHYFYRVWQFRALGIAVALMVGLQACQGGESPSSSESPAVSTAPTAGTQPSSPAKSVEPSANRQTADLLVGKWTVESMKDEKGEELNFRELSEILKKQGESAELPTWEFTQDGKVITIFPPEKPEEAKYEFKDTKLVVTDSKGKTSTIEVTVNQDKLSLSAEGFTMNFSRNQ